LKIYLKETLFDSKGNLTTLVEMTHWTGRDVLYIGDHIYGDLAVSEIINKDRT